MMSSKPSSISVPAQTETQRQAYSGPVQATSDPIDFPTVGIADVAIFWDYENVRIPNWCPPSTASEGIRNKVAKYGRIVEKRLYYDSRQPTEYTAPRSDLDLSGFTLVDCPSRNRKETLDKKLIVDVQCFAWERASRGAKACVVLITSDGDYSYALARLRDIGVFTVIIYRPDIVAKVLIDNANVVMSWDYDVLGGPPQHEEEEHDSLNCVDNNQDKLPAVLSTVVEPPSDSTPGNQTDQSPGVVVKHPNPQTRGKFALFCSVVLNAQYRNVQEGISVYSSWADEGTIAATFYSKVGEKDRDAYLNIRTTATQKGFIEFGRRNVSAPGKPVIKTKDREDRGDGGLSSETYLRLTYSGLAVLKPSLAANESDWNMVLPKSIQKQRFLESDGSIASSTSGQPSPARSVGSSKGGGKLFVGGLAWQTTEDSLQSYFRQFGPLDTVVVIQGRGFGFVFFRNINDANIVLKNAGTHFVDNKSIDVKPYNK